MDRLDFLTNYKNTKVIYYNFIQTGLVWVIIEDKLIHSNNCKEGIITFAK